MKGQLGKSFSGQKPGPGRVNCALDGPVPGQDIASSIAILPPVAASCEYSTLSHGFVQRLWPANQPHGKARDAAPKNLVDELYSS